MGFLVNRIWCWGSVGCVLRVPSGNQLPCGSPRCVYGHYRSPFRRRGLCACTGPRFRRGVPTVSGSYRGLFRVLLDCPIVTGRSYLGWLETSCGCGGVLTSRSTQQIVGPEPREASFASSVIRRRRSVR